MVTFHGIGRKADSLSSPANDKILLIVKDFIDTLLKIMFCRDALDRAIRYWLIGFPLLPI